MTPNLTLLLVTYNRARLLGRLLELAFAQEQTGPVRLALLAVDNNSSDDTSELLRRLLPAAPFPARALVEPRQGKAFALQQALEIMETPYYLILDDDLLPPPDWARRMLEPVLDRPSVGVVGGRVNPVFEAPPPAWLREQFYAPLGVGHYGDEPFLVGADHPRCLLAGLYRTEAVRAVGGYDTRLGVSGAFVGGTEDSELQLRLFGAGWQGYYTPEAVVGHLVPPTRLSKSYHRRWHHGHGRSHARTHRGPVPRSVFGDLVRASLGWCRHGFAGQSTARFEQECVASFCLGFLRESLAPGHEPVANPRSVPAAG
jgi:GT2 family glycosyltransferase